jgi:hypothetical protein
MMSALTFNALVQILLVQFLHQKLLLTTTNLGLQFL